MKRIKIGNKWVDQDVLEILLEALKQQDTPDHEEEFTRVFIKLDEGKRKIRYHITKDLNIVVDWIDPKEI